MVSKNKEIEKLTADLSNTDFWKDRQIADEKLKKLGELKDLIKRFDEIENGINELKNNFKEDLYFEILRKFRNLELENLFTGRYDKQPATISIFPGAGGEDAEDWAKMLFEMYEKYAAMRGWKTKTLDDSPNRRTMAISGDWVYGYLKNESGVHRLVRISPFSAKKLRHTSFALVEVVPELPDLEESKINIPESDLKWDFYRSSGPGGQNVNKVETAVRGTHIPTGITVSSQAERSQLQNRERVLSLLKAKLFQLMEKNQTEELGNLRTKVKPEWGNQIRSYVLNPYKMVKDHRTEIETAQVDDVLGGDLDNFIEGEIEVLKEK
ncbi:MAG: PCRF domain-containing protein [Patescibacteria group bacterium]|nr:PCRF domain-containing protein [Patescibacteria group bacterium]